MWSTGLRVYGELFAPVLPVAGSTCLEIAAAASRFDGGLRFMGLRSLLQVVELQVERS